MLGSIPTGVTCLSYSSLRSWQDKLTRGQSFPEELPICVENGEERLLHSLLAVESGTSENNSTG